MSTHPGGIRSRLHRVLADASGVRFIDIARWGSGTALNEAIASGAKVLQTASSVWQPGEYYEKRKPAPSTGQACDPELARQLWDRGAELLSIATR